MKLIRLIFFRICRVTLTGICLLPLIGYCQSLGNRQDSGQQWGLITDYSDQITPTTAGQVYNWLVDAAISPCTNSSNVWTCALIRSGNYQGLAVWFYSANETDTTSYTPDGQFVQYRDLAGNVTPVTGAITIGPQPILLESGPPP